MRDLGRISRSPRRAFKLVTLGASLALVLVALEGLVRLLGLETASYHSISGFCRHDPDLGWSLVPDKRTVFRGRHFSAVVETSAQGLRDRYYPLEPGHGRRRILVLGDSVAWCWGVEMEHCFTKLLEAGLPETDVITMGVPGYSTAQEMLMYERDGRRFHADLVLLVFCGNDLADNLDARRRPRFVLDDGELSLTNHPVPRTKGRFKEWLSGNSRLYALTNFGTQVGKTLLEGWLDSGAGNEPYVLPSPAAQAESWALTEALLARFQHEVENDGAEFAIAIVDTPEAFTRELIRYCATSRCRVADLGPALERARSAGLATRLSGDPHLAPAGQRVAADALLPLVGVAADGVAAAPFD